MTKAHGVFHADGESLIISPTRAPKHPRSFPSFRSALHTRLQFFPSESLLAYTLEANAPLAESEGDGSSAEFGSLPDDSDGEGYIRRKRPTISVARWVPNCDSVDTPSESNITPNVRAVSVPSCATSNAANSSFDKADFVTDDTLLVIDYAATSTARMEGDLGIKACLNEPTAT